MIITKRLRIERAQPSDIEFIMELEADRANNKFIWSGTYEEHLKEIQSRDYLVLIIRDRFENTNLGFSINHIDYESDRFEFRRVAIDKKGLGYGKEAMVGIIHYAFSKLKTNRFWLDVYPDNMVGIKLYESLHMHRDAILRQNHREDRGLMDQIVYSILRPEYEKYYKNLD